MELHFEDTYIQILEEKYFSLSQKKMKGDSESATLVSRREN